MTYKPTRLVEGAWSRPPRCLASGGRANESIGARRWAPGTGLAGKSEKEGACG